MRLWSGLALGGRFDVGSSPLPPPNIPSSSCPAVDDDGGGGWGWGVSEGMWSNESLTFNPHHRPHMQPPLAPILMNLHLVPSVFHRFLLGLQGISLSALRVQDIEL